MCSQRIEKRYFAFSRKSAGYEADVAAIIVSYAPLLETTIDSAVASILNQALKPEPSDGEFSADSNGSSAHRMPMQPMPLPIGNCIQNFPSCTLLYGLCRLKSIFCFVALIAKLV
ncbi:unnamed protein product [Strongylus vulgaris]|uniref:Uncharacterized protein n=1 Tax=Strongylus vulgaris TaxID=40348 RepID=A0A3P7JUG2_STRVU|nr:unnamed protein product [Strongylus vulgaris]